MRRGRRVRDDGSVRARAMLQASPVRVCLYRKRTSSDEDADRFNFSRDSGRCFRPCGAAPGGRDRS